MGLLCMSPNNTSLVLKILEEHGYESALLGISLSFNADVANMPQRAEKLAHLGRGESKFLEFMLVWMDITGSRAWWSQFDTYRHVTKQSESTMHTILKKPLTQSNFREEIPESWLNHLNQLIAEKRLEVVKSLLPEGFLQRRIVCTSYKTLQNMYAQRSNHKLSEWRMFCEYLLVGLQHPNFIKAQTK